MFQPIFLHISVVHLTLKNYLNVCQKRGYESDERLKLSARKLGILSTCDVGGQPTLLPLLVPPNDRIYDLAILLFRNCLEARGDGVCD